MAYLSTKNLNLPKGRARKLLPKYLGPYKIVEASTDASTYTLELPEELRKRGIFPKFHASLLKKYEKNDEALFPHREPMAFYDFGTPEETEWLVDEIVGHQWEGREVKFHVKWNLGDTTWEPYSNCKDLEALDRYLEIHGAPTVKQLPRKEGRTARGRPRKKVA